MEMSTVVSNVRRGMTNDISRNDQQSSVDPLQSNSITMDTPRTIQNATPSQSTLTVQPSVVGESWYASYVMRGYTPGHNSVHRPIGDCNETVQSISCDKTRDGASSKPSQPRQKPGLEDLPSPELVNRLIEVYFDRFHAFCPIFERKYFFTSLHEGKMSETLLRSVLFVASLHCDLEVLHLMGHSTRLDANHELFTKASASFDLDRESSRMHMILSSYLLHYWFGNPTAYRDCHWWLAAAIRSAQCTGYHRSTSNSQMPPEERRRWKCIWWCLYVRDRQIAISTGTPMVINDLDYDVEELVVQDFPEEAPETAHYMVAQAKLSKAEQFPMIYVSALFSAMMALAADGGATTTRSDQLFGKIRRGLLALKQFEPVYILARWIRNFFMDILNRSEANGMGDAQGRETCVVSDGHRIDASNPENSGTNPDQTNEVSAAMLPSEDQATHPTPDIGDDEANFMFDQGSGDDCVGFEGGGFWPSYLANGVFSNTHLVDTLDFPQPDSSQYQAISRRHTGLYVFGLSAIGVIGTLTFYGRPLKLQQLSTQSLANTPKIEHDVSIKNINAACKEFAAILGAQNISTDRADLVTHSGSDYQSYPWTEGTAVCSHVILYPETTEQVSELMKVCFRRRLPVTPYSGGTSIEGQYIPHFQGICVDFGRMDRIVELNTFDLDCVVQPGIGWMDLNEELASHGLFFPPDPGPGAMIGGMVGTGCSGTNAAAYGTMKDWVLSLTVVLADGTIIKTRQRARKSSAGYDLTRTFIGSEGTLGLVTEATLKLAVKPPCEAVAVCTFPTLRDAASAVREVLSQGIQVAAVEILDEVQMRSINESALTRLKWKEEPTLFFKFTGSDEFIVQHLAKQVGHITKRNRSTEYTFASDEKEREELWSARKNALWSMLAMRKSPTDKVWTTDVAVPLSRLPDIIEFAKDDIEKSGLLGSVVGHVGDGNFHTLLLFPEDKRHIAEDIVHRMVDKAIEMNGTATGEHGVGLVKRDYLEKELGKGAVDTMRAMKNAFDPKCLLNCDKVIRMQAA
ncbi:hypothetical protein FAVG1_02822 [Fusarium avenaceum]|nr:hypothetical protein FAVG1_02822 [Fusarium avenaceum]